MNFMAHSASGRAIRPIPADGRPTVQKRLPQHRTNRIERLLLMGVIILLSQDRSIGGGFSLGFVILGLCGSYVLFKRHGILARVLLDPLFMTAYGLLALSSLIEFFHPYASYREILRIGQMFSGAMIIASLCRDRPALRAAMHGYLIAGVLLSVLMFLTSFNALSGASATNFQDANRVRGEVFKDSAVNVSPLISTNGAVVALAATLAARSVYRRYMFLTIAAFCSIATALPLSRGGIIIMAAAFAAVMFASGIWRGRTILIAGIIGAAFFVWVPNVMWARFAFPTETLHGRQEARTHVYTAAVEHFPEYVMTGVGVGNFWGPWGDLSKFGGVGGPHNVFIAVTIYWGLPGLVALIAVVWQAYRCLPRLRSSDPLGIQLLGISIAVFIMSLTIHNLYVKEFSLILGLLVGARRWIWPKDIAQLVTRKHRAFPRNSARTS